MKDLSENSIKISLNIEIPLNGQAPCVNVSTSSRSHKVGFDKGIIRITDFPHALGTPTHIDSGNTICANGTADDEGQPPNTIIAKIYPGNYSTSPADPTFELGTTILNHPASTNWVFEHLSGATPSGTFTVVVWAKWDGSPFVKDARVFQTDSGGPYTDCTAPGQSWGKQSLAGPCTFELIPVAWKLTTRGFSGSSAARLNGDWTLHLTKAPGQKVLYCNGGDGVTTPRIQLCCEHPLAPVWELSFTLAGNRVAYRHPANQFDGQCRNVFQNAVTVGFGEDAAIPAIISILPV